MTIVAEAKKETSILPIDALVYLRNLFKTYLGASVALPDDISSLIETDEKGAESMIGEIQAAIDKKLDNIDRVPFQCLIGLSLYEIITTGRQDKIYDIATLLEMISTQESLLEERDNMDCISTVRQEHMDLVYAIAGIMTAWQEILEAMKKNEIDPYECQNMINAGKIIYEQQNPGSLLGEEIEFKLKK